MERQLRFPAPEAPCNEFLTLAQILPAFKAGQRLIFRRPLINIFEVCTAAIATVDGPYRANLPEGNEKIAYLA